MKTVVAAIGLALALSVAPFIAAQPSTARIADTPAARPIPFRQDDSFGDLARNVGIALVVAIGAAVGVLYVLRRYLVNVQQAPGRRLRVIETLRLGPKSTLFLIELDGRALLIGQHGDTLAVLANAVTARDSSPSQNAA